jgi:hypothetical protein
VIEHDVIIVGPAPFPTAALCGLLCLEADEIEREFRTVTVPPACPEAVLSTLDSFDRLVLIGDTAAAFGFPGPPGSAARLPAGPRAFHLDPVGGPETASALRYYVWPGYDV